MMNRSASPYSYNSHTIFSQAAPPEPSREQALPMSCSSMLRQLSWGTYLPSLPALDPLDLLVNEQDDMVKAYLRVQPASLSCYTSISYTDGNDLMDMDDWGYSDSEAKMPQRWAMDATNANTPSISRNIFPEWRPYSPYCHDQVSTVDDNTVYNLSFPDSIGSEIEECDAYFSPISEPGSTCPFTTTIQLSPSVEKSSSKRKHCRSNTNSDSERYDDASNVAQSTVITAALNLDNVDISRQRQADKISYKTHKQSLNESSMTDTSPSTTLTSLALKTPLELFNTHHFSSSLDLDPNEVVVGVYSRAERAAKITRYREKRAYRHWTKKIMYISRKSFADHRPRVGGRFIKLKLE